ncbi:MAG: class I SAM-dependent methyltransferase [Akkermansiaceae bacterium]
MSGSCRACGASELFAVASFARQPIASRFKRLATEPDEFFDLEVKGCETCGLVQLGALPSVEALRPRFDWLRYNEPEAHLDAVASAVAVLAPANQRVVGLTYKDNSFVERLGRLGFAEAQPDLAARALAGQTAPWGVETVAHWLGSGAAGQAARDAGLVVARHVLEHCDHPARAVNALLSWLGKDGLLLVEVPGCREALERGIPELLWEEHASYFTAPTLQRLLLASGAEIVHFSEHHYPFESSLVAMVRTAKSSPAELPGDDVLLAQTFGKQVAGKVDATSHGLRHRKDAGQRTVLFGAGHLSCAFLSLSSASDCVECVLDDTPQKQGLFMAGTQLPISATADLPAGEPGLCLMAVHPSAEEKVHHRLAPLREAGWETASIFPDSPYAVRWN